MDLSGKRTETFRVTVNVCSHMHSCDLLNCVYVCANVHETCVPMCGVVVSVCWVPLCCGCLCARLSVCNHMHPLGVNVHLHVSLCIQVTSFLQVQLGSSYLQSFLSCVRSLQARTVQSFLQPVPYHRYESKEGADTVSQRYPSQTSRKESWGLRETGMVTGVGRDCICLVEGR